MEYVPGHRHGGHTDRDPIPSPHGSGRVPQSLQGCVLWSLEAEKWGKQAVTSWEKPSWEKPSWERPKGRPSTSNYLHFFQNNSIWNKFDAKTHTGSILYPHYTPPHVVRAAWDKMFSRGSLLQSIHLTLPIAMGIWKGPVKTSRTPKGRWWVCTAHAGGGGAGKHRLRPCFYHAFSKTLVSNTGYSRILRKVQESCLFKGNL